MVDSRATKQIAEYVCYERWMLDYCIGQLPSEPGRLMVVSTQSGISESSWDKRLRMSRESLAVEGMLLHARSLRDFFLGNTSYSDDVRALHFILEPKRWQPDGLLPYLKANRERLNQLTIHLSYNRESFIRQGLKEWDHKAIRNEIAAAWEKFLNHVDARTREWFRYAAWPEPSVSFSTLSASPPLEERDDDR
jgi:hypothetical protein